MQALLVRTRAAGPSGGCRAIASALLVVSCAPSAFDDVGRERAQEPALACDASQARTSASSCLATSSQHEAGVDAGAGHEVAPPAGDEPANPNMQRLDGGAELDASRVGDGSPVLDTSAASDPTLTRDATPSGAASESDGGDAGRGPLPCLPPLARCGDACVDLRSDEQHCGGCEVPCSASALCEAARCESGPGCADGTREGFVDVRRYPTIAGCAAHWPSSSLRAARLGAPCGNSLDFAACLAPVDACARGWHVCGNALSGPADLTARIGEDDCLAQPGRWAAALGDFSCTSCESGFGAGAVCCGAACLVQGGDCVWPGRTPWFGLDQDNYVNACGSIVQPQLSVEIGVMCCRD